MQIHVSKFDTKYLFDKYFCKTFSESMFDLCKRITFCISRLTRNVFQNNSISYHNALYQRLIYLLNDYCAIRKKTLHKISGSFNFQFDFKINMTLSVKKVISIKYFLIGLDGRYYII